MQIGSEEYKVWGSGIYAGTLYTADEKNGNIMYIFYPGVVLTKNNDGKLVPDSSKLVLFPSFYVKKGQPVTDEMISEAFANELAKNILTNINEKNSEYPDVLLTIPEGFFTQHNCDLVLKATTTGQNPQTKDLYNSLNIKNTHDADGYELDLSTNLGKLELSCRQLMQYAHNVNPDIILGQNLHSKGQDYLPRNFGN